ncbi:MAG: carboxymuconolactone decarboxylase family protein [Vicinamibacterales bacterium]
MNYTVHSIESAPAASKDTLAAVARAYGFLPNLMGVMAEAPAALKAYPTLIGLFDQTSFTPTERQVVLLATSVENGCDYCVAAHTVIAGMQGVAGEVVQAIRAGQPLADTRLEALRRFTIAVVGSRGRVSDADTTSFLGAGYTLGQVLEVVLGVAIKTLSNYVNHIAETPIDGAFAAAASPAA